jgi:hypothetical protein
MPRKSKLRTMATSRFLRWALMRALCRLFPTLARTWTFPLRAVCALDVADHVFENRIEELRFGESVDPAVDRLLQKAAANDAGDTSTYAEHRSPVSSWLVTIPDCIISGRTLAVMYGPEQAVVAREPVAPNWNAAKPERLRLRQAEPVQHLTLTSGGHYYHFFANDLVPLLHFYARYGHEIGPLRVVVPEGSPAFVEASIRALSRAYPQIGISYVGRLECLTGVRALWQSRSALTLEWMVVNRQEAEHLTTLFVAEYGLPDLPDQHTGQKLFISRGAARLRRLFNERDVGAVLSARGFETFTPAGDNHAEQVDRFRRADVVVAVHGAALTNLLFCRPGTLVVELFAADHVKSGYAWLAHRLGLRYRAVVGSNGNLQQGFSVKPQSVADAIE